MIKKIVRKNKDENWSGFAIAGFILSLLPYTAILGIIFSAIGLSATSNNKKRGRGLAIAGLVIGIFTMLLLVIGIIWVVVRNVVNGGI